MGHLRTYAEVARTYGVTTRTVRTWASKGAIDVVRTPGGRPRVRVDTEVSGSPGDNPLPPETHNAHTT